MCSRNKLGSFYLLIVLNSNAEANKWVHKSANPQLVATATNNTDISNENKTKFIMNNAHCVTVDWSL